MKRQVNEFEGIKYIISFPDEYEENTKYPIIFFCMVRVQEVMI